MTKRIEIRQAGCTIAVPEGVTILEAALAGGIAYPHADVFFTPEETSAHK